MAVTHSRGQAEKSPRLDESSSGWPEPCPILISQGKPTHRVMARTALLRRHTQAPGRVKPNENVTEREWFCQMRMLPSQGLLLLAEWWGEQRQVDILRLAIHGTGQAMMGFQEVVDLLA